VRVPSVGEIMTRQCATDKSFCFTVEQANRRNGSKSSTTRTRTIDAPYSPLFVVQNPIVRFGLNSMQILFIVGFGRRANAEARIGRAPRSGFLTMRALGLLPIITVSESAAHYLTIRPHGFTAGASNSASRATFQRGLEPRQRGLGLHDCRQPHRMFRSALGRRPTKSQCDTPLLSHLQFLR